jgi:CRISPR-associated protein (TIGR02710 family)
VRQLTPVVEGWLARGADYRVVVDFTGGTKCMSAALALQAHRWRCLFGYVGGSERTKEGVGIVVSGKEQVLHCHNPWDALGYQAVEDAVILFDQGAFPAAGRLLERALRNVENPARKRELQAVRTLAEAYEAWERFDHPAAAGKLVELEKYANDLHALFGAEKADRLHSELQAHQKHLAALDIKAGPTRELVLDLLANARRRAAEGRHDDAVARLYRAIEAVAQVRLRQQHAIPETEHVPLDRVPESLRGRWASRAEEGQIKLGLQEDYALLAELGDPLGQRFQDLRLHDWQRSPLSSRNQSILAHGFRPVGNKVFEALWRAALQLADVEEGQLPAFPRLGS